MAKRIVSRLRQLRLNKSAQLGREVTIKEVCAHISIAESTLSRIENNPQEPIRFATLEKLADFYGVSDIRDLIALEEIRRALRFALTQHITKRRAGSEVHGLAAI